MRIVRLEKVLSRLYINMQTSICQLTPDSSTAVISLATSHYKSDSPSNAGRQDMILSAMINMGLFFLASN